MAALPHSFVQLFVDLNLAKYTSLAAVTVLVYDYFILLPDEIALIWPSRWSISKCLFIANRYLAFVDPTMIIYLLMFGERAGVCVNTFRAIGVFTTIGIMVAQWILLLRTYAVWGSKISKPFVCVFVCYVCIGVVDSWASHKYVNGVHSTGVPGKGMTGCTLFFANRLAWVSFVGIMAIESALISLLVYKAVQHFRVARSSLMTILYRDGLLYFAFVLATSIVNLVVVLVAPIELHSFLIVYVTIQLFIFQSVAYNHIWPHRVQRVLHSAFCSRILLHIRGAYHDLIDGQDNETLPTIVMASNINTHDSRGTDSSTDSCP